MPLVSKGKAQKQPLELLKALVAHGGRNVDAAMLTALLWPDAEGDDAKTSFDSNLYRLRKLLDVDGALALAEGKLSLDAGVVWLDVWAFEQALDATPPDVDAALALLSRPFPRPRSAGAVGAAAARPAAGAARARRARTRPGAAKRERDFAAARALYERALELDNLAEAVYRRLMVCQRELGDPGRRADHLPPLPRAAVDRARPQARGRDRGDPRDARPASVSQA